MGSADGLHRIENQARRTLSSLPSVVSQLIWLASLRDIYTGGYLHEGWTTLASPQEVDRMAREIHSQALGGVVELKLETLCRQLLEHFESHGGSVRELAEVWLETESFRVMLPRDCSPVERSLFISQMRTALAVLMRSPDLSVLSEPTASQLPPPDQPLPPHPES